MRRRRTVLALVATFITGSGWSYIIFHHDKPSTVQPQKVALGAKESRLTTAKARAKQYWHAVPCGGVYVVSFARLKHPLYGFAHYSQLSDGAISGCTIRLARSRFGPGTHATFAVFCSVFIHEYGHLLRFMEVGGGEHSRDPSNVMYPTLTTRNVPEVCKPSSNGGDRSAPPGIKPGKL